MFSPKLRTWLLLKYFYRMTTSTTQDFTTHWGNGTHRKNFKVSLAANLLLSASAMLLHESHSWKAPSVLSYTSTFFPIRQDSIQTKSVVSYIFLTAAVCATLFLNRRRIFIHSFYWFNSWIFKHWDKLAKGCLLHRNQRHRLAWQRNSHFCYPSASGISEISHPLVGVVKLWGRRIQYFSSPGLHPKLQIWWGCISGFLHFWETETPFSHHCFHVQSAWSGDSWQGFNSGSNSLFHGRLSYSTIQVDQCTYWKPTGMWDISLHSGSPCGWTSPESIGHIFGGDCLGDAKCGRLVARQLSDSSPSTASLWILFQAIILSRIFLPLLQISSMRLLSLVMIAL